MTLPFNLRTPPGIYNSDRGVVRNTQSSTDPESVMEENRIEGVTIKTVNPDLFYYFEFKFYNYNSRTVYDVVNDSAGTSVRSENEAVIVGILGDVLIGGANNVHHRERLTSQLNAERDRADTANRARAVANRARVNEILAEPKAIVQFPLPANLIENYTIDFQSGELGLQGRTLLDIIIRSGQSGVERAIRDAVADPETYNRLFTSARNEIINAIPALRDAITAGMGVVKNPVHAAVFKGVPLRTHQFTWKLVPESPEEHDKMIDCFDTIKKHILPPFESAGQINNIAYPDFCMINLEPELYQLPKPCFVQNFSINKAPDGFPALYKDDRPVAYEVTVQLLEATALTREDIFPQWRANEE